MTVTETKERPILFSPAMVRAILEGRKMQTRRVIKPQPMDVIAKKEPWAKYATRTHDAHKCWCAKYSDNPPRGKMIYCKYGEIGDRLWVRETWIHIADSFDGMGDCTYYKAEQSESDEKFIEKYGLKWKPSIHMPRWASRILLEITNVRVERVQDIRPADCMAEGVMGQGDGTVVPKHGWRGEFSELWNSVQKRDCYDWYANPYVWVIEFKRLKP